MTAGKPADGLPLDPVNPSQSFGALLEGAGLTPQWDTGGEGSENGLVIPEGTTVLALAYTDGVVMAGDRRATAGNLIAHRRVQKVFPSDRYSAVAISGTAGIAIELVKLFQTELEHYEKLEGHRLSLEGKANYLASMVRRHLPMAFQGLVVIPLFCGYDEVDRVGRLYSFDVVGGRYEETEYAATGSGGRDAKLYIRSKWEGDLSEEDAMQLAVEALIVAAEEDTATGGPDMKRGIYPNVVVVGPEGYREVEDDEIADISRAALEAAG